MTGEKIKNQLHTLMAAILFTSLAHAATRNTTKIEELTQLKEKLNEKEGVFKVTYPRSDLSVVSNGVKTTPPMGLTENLHDDHEMLKAGIIIYDALFTWRRSLKDERHGRNPKALASEQF